MLFGLVAASLWATPSYASLKCEEIVANRFCADNAPKPYEVGPALTVLLQPPVLDGYGSACWSWTRQFQCIETDPVYQCASGSNFNTVKRECSLTAAAVNSSVKVNGVDYITSATYDYKCAWGEWTTDEKLPTNKECVGLKESVADTTTVPSLPIGSQPSVTDPKTDSLVTEQTKTGEYVCYLPQDTKCTDVCYEHVTDPSTGKISQKEVACTSAVTQCTTTSKNCVGSQGTDSNNVTTSQAQGPDGRCVAYDEQQMCQSGPVPACLTNQSCTLTSTNPTSIQNNGVALGQEQTYVCTNTTKSCEQIANVSNCVHVGAWGWDNMNMKSDMGQGLGDANQALAKIEGMQKGQKNDDPYIFSGQDLKCHFAVGNFLNTFIVIAALAVATVATGGGALAAMASALEVTTAQAAAMVVGASFLAEAGDSTTFGAACCKEYVIEGSDAWFKLGACTGDEVKLAVARKKELAVYLGEYCSKKGGFPVRQCVERSKTYCVFDDMLALTVNQQGRQQLDAIAKADPLRTKATEELSFPLYSSYSPASSGYKGVLNNGQWVKRATESNSAIWTWQYPGYCVSQATQASAYKAWSDEMNAMASTQGVQPGQMTPAQALTFYSKLKGMVSFQECPDSPGLMQVMTCSKSDDSCDEKLLPESPDLVDAQIDGKLTQSDVNWRVNSVRTFHMPGDYGVTASMRTNSSFAAVSGSINSFISGTGSCHTDGNCLYTFAITDKRGGGSLGAKKRVIEYIKFPLYSVIQTSNQPSITYVSQSGVLDTAAYQADPNRGRATPIAVSTQRFIFHPNYLTKALDGNIHAGVLLEYANKKLSAVDPENDYRPIVVPTTLPPGTPGFYPYGDGTTGGSFYLSGGCDANSRWCTYAVEVDLDVPRHPWGSAQEPRCWGFTVEQLAALDFDKMDLSKWINSLDLGGSTEGMTAQAAKAMSDQVLATAQTFYSTVSTGGATAKPGAGTAALVTNTDVLPYMSADNFSTFTIQAAIPSNWPIYNDDSPNTNPVSNVRIDWGDGKSETMPKHPEGRAFFHTHDYGGTKSNPGVGTYTIRVTLDTANNGPQTLTTAVRITPSDGAIPKAPPNLVFNNPGSDGKAAANYSPSTTVNGTSQAPANLGTISPGMQDQFNRQGSSLTPPAKPASGGGN